MALSSCISLSNQTSPFNINETGTHGTLEFPVAIYRDDVTENFVNWHWHKEIEIGYIEEGTVLLESGNRKYTLTKGDLFFINTNVLHAMRNQTPTHSSHFLHRSPDLNKVPIRIIKSDNPLVSATAPVGARPKSTGLRAPP